MQPSRRVVSSAAASRCEMRGAAPEFDSGDEGVEGVFAEFDAGGLAFGESRIHRMLRAEAGERGAAFQRTVLGEGGGEVARIDFDDGELRGALERPDAEALLDEERQVGDSAK